MAVENILTENTLTENILTENNTSLQNEIFSKNNFSKNNDIIFNKLNRNEFINKNYLKSTLVTEIKKANSKKSTEETVAEENTMPENVISDSPVSIVNEEKKYLTFSNGNCIKILDATEPQITIKAIDLEEKIKNKPIKVHFEGKRNTNKSLEKFSKKPSERQKQFYTVFSYKLAKKLLAQGCVIADIDLNKKINGIVFHFNNDERLQKVISIQQEILRLESKAKKLTERVDN